MQKIIHRFHGKEMPVAIVKLASSILPAGYVDTWVEFNDPGKHDEQRGVGCWCIIASTNDGLLISFPDPLFSFVVDVMALVLADWVSQQYRPIVDQVWHLRLSSRDQVLGAWRDSWRQRANAFWSRGE